MRNNYEVEVLNNEVLLSKEDVLKKLDYLIENVVTGNEIKKMKNLKEKVKKISLEKLTTDINSDKIRSYYIDFEGKLYKGFLTDFYFEYDNVNHELYLSSFTSVDDVLIA